jgi:hypothetical protein
MAPSLPISETEPPGLALSLFMGTGLVEFAPVGSRGRVRAGRASPGPQPSHDVRQSPWTAGLTRQIGRLPILMPRVERLT